MSGKCMRGGKYLYYQCNSYGNKHHMRDCAEKVLYAKQANPLVWDWLSNLLCDEQNLEDGLVELRTTRSAELESKQERLSTIENLLANSKRKIERLTKAFASENDDMLATALRNEMKDAKRVYDALDSERKLGQTQNNQQPISDDEIKQIKQLAGTMRW